MSAQRLLAYVWALPTTMVGLLALLLASVSAPAAGRVRTCVVNGVLELHGGLITRFLCRCTPLPDGASAMTLGHVVLGRDQAALDRSRAHERVHVRQCERWGPLFIPAYLLASAVLWCRGRDFYEENPFEREAYAACP
jgi:hypothetical protein